MPRKPAGKQRRARTWRPGCRGRRPRCRARSGVNMLRLRLTTEAQPRWKNGQPAHSTTGVDSANWIQMESCGGTRSSQAEAGMWPPISSTNTGSVRAQRRSRTAGVMSASSWLGAASAVPSSGSSAMPQIGQLPGPVLADLRVHRAGVDRAGLRRGAGALRARYLPGSASELGPAAGRAEEVACRQRARRFERAGSTVMPQTGSLHAHPAGEAPRAGVMLPWLAQQPWPCSS